MPATGDTFCGEAGTGPLRSNDFAMDSVAPTDRAVLEALARKDDDMFAWIVTTHEQWARTLALRILGDLEEAEDAVQDAFLQLWQTGVATKWKGSFRTLIATLVTRRSLDRARKRRIRSLFSPRPAAAHDEPPVVVRIDNDQRRGMLRDGIMKLPERQRAALLLFHYEDMTLKDGAEAMNLSPKAFESLLIRARKALKTIVGDKR